MKLLTHLWIHCTATKQGIDYSDETILKWFKDRGWKHPGYHDIIHLDGRLSNLLPYDFDNFVSPKEIANGIKGFNSNARHISYVGGVNRFDHRLPEDTRTKPQRACMYEYCMQMIRRYPDIKIGGHNQVSVKACPSFDVTEWACRLAIPERNINYDYLVPHSFTHSSKYVGEDQVDLFDFNIYDGN